MLLGIFTLARPASALTGFIVAYGAVAVIMGVADILLYVRIAHFTGFGPIVSLLSGTLSVMAGVMLLVYPNAGKLILSVLVPLWFLAHCISRLSNLNKIRFFAGEFPYYFTLILNVLGLVLGGLMIQSVDLSAVRSARHRHLPASSGGGLSHPRLQQAGHPVLTPSTEKPIGPHTVPVAHKKARLTPSFFARCGPPAFRRTTLFAKPP